MKLLKRTAVGLLAAAMLVSAAACHPKDEVAMTIGDVQITSALYMCALIQADGEARNTVDEAKAAEAEAAGDTTTSTTSTTDYYAETVEDTEFSTWVRNRAEEICKDYASYTMKFDEAGLSFDEETQSTIDSAADMYWNSYGYSTIYEPNGVSFDTYKTFFTYSYKAEEYFMSVYGEEGTNPVPDEELMTVLTENYVAAQTLTGPYTTTDSEGNSTTLTDDEKAALKETFEGYAERLRQGESFETIYKEQNPNADASTDTEAEDAPADPYVRLFGSEDTSYASDHFEDVKNMAVNDVAVLEDETNGLTLVVRKDVTEDPYYFNNLRDQLLYDLKQEEMETTITEYGNSLAMDKNDFAINQFKPKKIVYPQGIQ